MPSIILWYIVYIVQGYLQLSRVAISTISCWHRRIETSFDSITKQNENEKPAQYWKKFTHSKPPYFVIFSQKLKKSFFTRMVGNICVFLCMYNVQYMAVRLADWVMSWTALGQHNICIIIANSKKFSDCFSLT